MVVGNIVAYRILAAPEQGLVFRSVGLAVIAMLAVVMASIAFYTPYLVFSGC